MTGLVSQEGLGWVHVYLRNLPGIMQVPHKISALKEDYLCCWRFAETSTHKTFYLRPTKNLPTFFTRVGVFTSDTGTVPYKVATVFLIWPIYLSILNRKHKSSCEVVYGHWSSDIWAGNSPSSYADQAGQFITLWNMNSYQVLEILQVAFFSKRKVNIW